MTFVSVKSKFCMNCKKEFTINDLNISCEHLLERTLNRRKYCSYDCYDKYHSKLAKERRINKLSTLECTICHYHDEPRILEIHHILERCNGGTDDVSNLIVLCPNCHSLVHHGFLKIEKSNGGDR